MINMPALKDREGDIIDIAEYYLAMQCKHLNIAPKEFSKSAMEYLRDYEWPNNLFELKSTIHQCVEKETGHIINTETLMSILKRAKSPRESFEHIKMPLSTIEERAIKDVIAFTEGRIDEAAKILGISPSTIYRKIQKWDKE